MTLSAPPAPAWKLWLERAFNLLLVILLCIGILWRFQWVNWNQDAQLHPDEYGLTNTLTFLRLPDGLEGYFNTRLSPLSPYPQYDESGQKLSDGPDNRMRWGQWPIILLRWAGELTGNTGYNEIRLTGRRFSALMDVLGILLLYLIGRRLFNPRIALLAAALSSLAVMQIQQSHFMTVDNFGVFFSMLALYAAVGAAQHPLLRRGAGGRYRPARGAWGWYAFFGAAFGMALGCKINLLPLAGLVLVAAFIAVADLKLKERRDLYAIAAAAAVHLALAGLVALLTFRVCHPMAFRAPVGDTTFFTWQLNPDWSESMKVASQESSGIGGGPPGEQWAHRPVLLFPWLNIVLWGMGLLLGLAAWGGFAWAAARFLRSGQDWQKQLIPLVWVGGYFFFMGTRWVKSIRYFLPIYPFLCLFAAWGLVMLWRRFGAGRLTWRLGIPLLAGALVLGGTLGWANAFTSAVYRQDHTRIQATRWIYQNIPAPFHLGLETERGADAVAVGAPDGLMITAQAPYVRSFTPQVGGTLRRLSLPHAAALGGDGPATLRVVIATDALGSQVISQALVQVAPIGQFIEPGARAEAVFEPAALQADRLYFLIAAPLDGQTVRVNRAVIANEHWDEGLPVYYAGYNPYGDLYRGLSNQVRWYDDENKRAMFMEILAEADYIILPSQRAIWSACRIPRTYPMTLEYYRALFDGRLGFELAAHFQAPMRLGRLYISDVGGRLGWDRAPELPLFNRSQIAAEEAFSVYDHPPVWIFAKRGDFDLERAAAVLYAVDLSQVVVQGPREADW